MRWITLNFDTLDGLKKNSWNRLYKRILEFLMAKILGRNLRWKNMGIGMKPIEKEYGGRVRTWSSKRICVDTRYGMGGVQNHLNRGLLAMNSKLGREKNTTWEAKIQTYTYLFNFVKTLTWFWKNRCKYIIFMDQIQMTTLKTALGQANKSCNGLSSKVFWAVIYETVAGDMGCLDWAENTLGLPLDPGNAFGLLIGPDPENTFGLPLGP